MNTQDIFCAKCQMMTPHSGELEINHGEMVFSCTNPDCGRFIKLPGTTTPEEFDAFIAAHQEANVGQISMEEAEARLAAIMNRQPAEQTLEV